MIERPRDPRLDRNDTRSTFFPVARAESELFRRRCNVIEKWDGFVGIRCYNHAAATTSRHVCKAEASARIETIEATIAPFYHAIGRATARWQHIEAGLFVLAPAIMQTDYKYSSVVFLHIQSADSKVKLVDRLCAA